MSNESPTIDPSEEVERATPTDPVNITKKQEQEIRKYIKKSQLTFREMLFVDYFTGTLQIKNKPPFCWNGTQSAIAAGYSKKTAGQKCAELLKKPAVKEMVEDRLVDLLALHRITAAKTLNHYAAIAYQDPGDLWDENGNIKDIKKMPKEVRLAIASFEVVEKSTSTSEEKTVVTSIKKIKMADKCKGLDAMKQALEMAGIELNINMTHSGPDGGPIESTVDLGEKTAKELARLYREMVRKPDD